jgi:hypothetical protein
MICMRTTYNWNILGMYQVHHNNIIYIYNIYIFIHTKYKSAAPYLFILHKYIPCIYHVYYIHILVYTIDNWHILVYTFCFQGFCSTLIADLWGTLLMSLGHIKYKGVQLVYHNPFLKKPYYWSPRLDLVLIHLLGDWGFVILPYPVWYASSALLLFLAAATANTGSK